MKRFLCRLFGHRMPLPLWYMLRNAIIQQGVGYTCDRCGDDAYEWQGQS